jgi:hypothetical protein
MRQPLHQLKLLKFLLFLCLISSSVYLKMNEGFLCIVPGTTLTRRPALHANRAGAVPSASTARKKGFVPCFGASSGTVARHGTKKPLCCLGSGHLGPGQIGLGPGGPLGIL